MAQHDPIKIIKPIAIWKTKSFWFGMVPAALGGFEFLNDLVQQGQAGIIADALAIIASPVVDLDPVAVSTWLKAVGTVTTFVVAYQRRGINQPYTADPAKEKAVQQAIEDGKSALEQGIAIGRASKVFY